MSESHKQTVFGAGRGESLHPSSWMTVLHQSSVCHIPFMKAISNCFTYSFLREVNKAASIPRVKYTLCIKSLAHSRGSDELQINKKKGHD